MQRSLFNKRNELLINLENKKGMEYQTQSINTNKKNDLKKEFEELKKRVNEVGNQRRRSEGKFWENGEEEKGETSRVLERDSERMKGEKDTRRGSIIGRGDRKSLNLILSEQSSILPTPVSTYRKLQNNLTVNTTLSFKKMLETLQKLIFCKLSHLSSRLTNLQSLIPSVRLPSHYSIKHFQLTISQLEHSNKSLFCLNSSLQSQLSSQRTKYQSQRSYYINQVQSLNQKYINKSKQSELKYEKMVLENNNTIQELKVLCLRNQEEYLQQLESKDIQIQEQKTEIEEIKKQHTLFKNDQQAKWRQELDEKRREVERRESMNKKLIEEKEKFGNEVKGVIRKEGENMKDIYVEVLEWIRVNAKKVKNQEQQRQKLRQEIGIEILDNKYYETILNLHSLIQQLKTQIQSKDTLISSSQSQLSSLQSALTHLQSTTIPPLQSRLLSLTSQNEQLSTTLISLQSSVTHLQQSNLLFHQQIQSLTSLCQQKQTQLLNISNQFSIYKQQSNMKAKNILFQHSKCLKQLQQQQESLKNQHEQQLTKLKEQNQKLVQKLQKITDEILKTKEQKMGLQSELKSKSKRQQCNVLNQKLLGLQLDQIERKKQQKGMEMGDEFRENVNKEFDMLEEYNNSDNFEIGEVEENRVEEREITDFFLRLKYGIERVLEGEEIEIIEVPKEVEKEYGELMRMIGKIGGREWSIVQGWEESREIGDSMMDELKIGGEEVDELRKKIQDQQKIITELISCKNFQQNTISQTQSLFSTIKQQSSKQLSPNQPQSI